MAAAAQERPGIFRIQPVRPVAELRAEALAAKPPAESGTFRKSDLVDLTTLDPRIKLDIRYATSDDFLSTPVYTSARAFLQRPAAEALLRAHRELMKQGYGVVIFDAYRPWYVTKIFWDATPPDKREFVADPAEGSRHNRGCAVDLSLYDLKTGREIEMTGGYDECRRARIPITRAEPRSSARIARSYGTPWSSKDSRCIRRNGGTTTTGTGRPTPSRTSTFEDLTQAARRRDADPTQRSPAPVPLRIATWIPAIGPTTECAIARRSPEFRAGPPCGETRCISQRPQFEFRAFNRQNEQNNERQECHIRVRFARQIGTGERNLMESGHAPFGERDSQQPEHHQVAHGRPSWPQPEEQTRRDTPHGRQP